MFLEELIHQRRPVRREFVENRVRLALGELRNNDFLEESDELLAGSRAAVSPSIGSLRI